MAKRPLKSFIVNRGALKRAKYIYLPLFIVFFVALLFAAELTNKPKDDYLSVSQSLKYKIPIVYSPFYSIEFGGVEELHPFDTKKHQRVFHILEDNADLQLTDIVIASKPSNEMLSLSHDKDYLESLNSSWTLARITELSFLRFFPSKLSRNIILEPMLYQTGGSLLAALSSLEHGWAINLGGGFHHASSYQGGGFCALADIGLIIKYLRQESKIKKVMIIDLDAHQGNGHERDFIDDEDTYILDMYNNEIYPNDVVAMKGIDLKVEIPAFTSDDYYLRKLKEALPKAFNDFQPDIIIYIAGTDILNGDPLGALEISMSGVVKRDEMVFEQAIKKDIPIVMLLGGGYQQSNASVIAESILNLKNKFDLF